MDEFPSNSHKSREKSPEVPIPKKQVTKVVTGTAKKQGTFQKLADGFLNRDLPTVKSYILLDVLLPAIKKAISDIVRNGIDMLLYGETDSAKRNTMASKVSYRSYSENRPAWRSDPRESSVRNGYGDADIEFQTYKDAKEVLDRMYEIISTYGIVSVGDLNDLAGISGSHTDNKYGWTDLSTAEPVRTRNGFVLKLPRAMPIN